MCQGYDLTACPCCCFSPLAQPQCEQNPLYQNAAKLSWLWGLDPVVPQAAFRPQAIGWQLLIESISMRHVTLPRHRRSACWSFNVKPFKRGPVDWAWQTSLTPNKTFASHCLFVWRFLNKKLKFLCSTFIFFLFLVFVKNFHRKMVLFLTGCTQNS